MLVVLNVVELVNIEINIDMLDLLTSVVEMKLLKPYPPVTSRTYPFKESHMVLYQIHHLPFQWMIKKSHHY